MAEASKKLGGLWINNKGDRPFAKGSIMVNGQRQKIVVWRNTYKNKETDFDLTIELDTWTPGQKPAAKPAQNEAVPF